MQKAQLKIHWRVQKRKKKYREKYHEGKKWKERKKDIMRIQSQVMFVNSSAKIRIWKKEILRKSWTKKKEYKKNTNMQAIYDEKENMKKKQIWGKFWTKTRTWKNKYDEILQPRKKYRINKYEGNPESKLN